MSLLTNWGYELANVSTLPPLITKQEFNDYTAGKYSGDSRIDSNIQAVSAAIRNYCGWHVYPSIQCQFSTTFFDRRVAVVRRSIMVQLPAKFVTAVSKVVVDGRPCSAYVVQTNGLIKVYDALFSRIREYSTIEIEYTAGLSSELTEAVKELAAHRITHALASSAGIQSETAGGVSITYSANWTNSARSTALADDNKEVLEPYRVQGVF